MLTELHEHRLEVKKALDFAPINNDLSKLIVNPNEMQTWRDFITLVRTFYFVQGEAFVYREAGDDDCALSFECRSGSFGAFDCR